MENANPTVFITILIVIFCAPVIIASVLEQKRKKLLPNHRPFTWGYYNAIWGFALPVILPFVVGNEPQRANMGDWEK